MTPAAFAVALAALVAAEPTLVLENARVLAPDGGSFLTQSAIVVAGDRIDSIGAAPATGGTTRLDLANAFVIPGLIDLHTHLLLHPYDEAPWNDQVLKESLEFRTVRGVAAARATLEAGFTTIRDLGTEGAGFADVGLRDAVRARIVPGPRILAATKALVTTGGYGPLGYDPRWDVPRGAQVADGADGVRRAVREQVAAGADWIKAYADYRRAAGAAATPTFTEAELAAIVDEARSARLPVAAHATTDEGIARAVRAGVKTIEHGYDASDATLDLMAARGTILCPTIAAVEATARQAGWKPGDPEPGRLTAAKRLVARARQRGVTVACGSDAGVFAHGANAREIELLAAAGLAPADALRSATAIAAAAIGREKDLGRLSPGFLADLVVLRSDPLADPNAIRGVVLVVQEGRVVFDSLGASR